MPEKYYSHELWQVFNFASMCEERWSAEESVDWQDAEDLVGLLRKLDPTLTPENLKKTTQDILAHADHNEDWDSGEVGNWPLLIIEALNSDGNSHLPSIYEIRVNFIHVPDWAHNDKEKECDASDLEDEFYDLYVYAPDEDFAREMVQAWTEEEISIKDTRFKETPIEPSEVSARYVGDTEEIQIIYAKISD